MSIDRTQLERLVTDTLKKHSLHSDSAVALILATIAQESALGTYIHQIHGPALGICQMEPATFEWLRGKFPGRLGGREAEELVGNLELSILACRLRYLASPGVLPDADDLEGLWKYYKRNYNSVKGAATREQFMANYKKYLT